MPLRDVSRSLQGSYRCSSSDLPPDQRSAQWIPWPVKHLPRAKGANAFLFLIMEGRLYHRSGMKSSAASKQDSTSEVSDP